MMDMDFSRDVDCRFFTKCRAEYVTISLYIGIYTQPYIERQSLP
jgi:hypothetical protein